MKRIFFIFYITIFCILSSLALSPEEEYDCLYKDLRNVNTYAYKCTLNDSGKSEGVLTMSQGSLYNTEYSFNFAIVGNGFFKVIDEAGNVFYTRYGELLFTIKFKLVIRCNSKIYYLPLKPLPESFESTGFKISKNGKVTSQYIKDNDTTESEDLGMIQLYDIKVENIESYDGFVIQTKKEPQELSKEEAGKFYQRFLEQSDVSLNLTLLRMLFLLEEMDDSQVKCKETKIYIIKQLLKTDFQNRLSENISKSEDLEVYIFPLERNYN